MKLRIVLIMSAVAAALGVVAAPVAAAAPAAPPFTPRGTPCSQFFPHWGDLSGLGNGGQFVLSPWGTDRLICFLGARGDMLVQLDPAGVPHVLAGGMWVEKTRVWWWNG